MRKIKKFDPNLLTITVIVLLLSLVRPNLSEYQIPFKISSGTSKHDPDPSTKSSFQLQHAVHITTSKRNRGLHLWRNFTSSDRIQIDSRASSSAEDGNEDSFYVSSTHQLKLKKSSIWTHRASFKDWLAARQSQIALDRQIRNRRTTNSSSSSSSDPLTKGFVNQNFNSSQLDWFQAEVEVPDTSDIDTLAGLAKMTNDAYCLPDDDRWFEPGSPWNNSKSFGWDDDGLRGHVFATPDNSTIVISIKGTSAGILGNGGSTSANDKINDNLLFSCCCARVGWSWTTVCDCYDGGNRCKQSCLEDAIIDKSAYYMAGVDLFNDVVKIYPNSQIWLSGHSLGGSIAGLLGLTFGVPVVGFEAPGDLLAARRLHLPLPPGGKFGDGSELSQVTHVFHTADPIAMGVCNGAISSCSVAGYALETRCHIGQTIVFDTVDKLNWAVDIRTHSIKTVIDKVLISEWKAKSKSASTISSKGLKTKGKCKKTLSISKEGEEGLMKIKWPWKKKKKNDDDEDGNDDEDGGNGDSCGNEDDGDGEDEDERIVPSPTTQNCEGENSDCGAWEFKDSWD